MILPKLPKKNKKKELDFGTSIFRPWVFEHPPLVSGVYELKSTSTDSIPFSALEDIQIDALLTVKHGKKGYLIRNMAGTPGAPDYSYYKNDPAFVVIKYPKGFVIIDIDVFLLEKNRSKRKSLTYDRAVWISQK